MSRLVGKEKERKKRRKEGGTPFYLPAPFLTFHSTLRQAAAFRLRIQIRAAIRLPRFGFQGPVAVHPEYAHKFIIEYYSLKRQWRAFEYEKKEPW